MTDPHELHLIAQVLEEHAAQIPKRRWPDRDPFLEGKRDGIRFAAETIRAYADQRSPVQPTTLRIV